MDKEVTVEVSGVELNVVEYYFKTELLRIVSRATSSEAKVRRFSCCCFSVNDDGESIKHVLGIVGTDPSVDVQFTVLRQINAFNELYPGQALLIL